MATPKKEKTNVTLDKVRFFRDGDLRKVLLEAKPDEVFLIGENVIEATLPVGAALGTPVEKQVELVWAKVFRTKG